MRANPAHKGQTESVIEACRVVPIEARSRRVK